MGMIRADHSMSHQQSTNVGYTHKKFKRRTSSSSSNASSLTPQSSTGTQQYHSIHRQDVPQNFSEAVGVAVSSLQQPPPTATSIVVPRPPALVHIDELHHQNPSSFYKKDATVADSRDGQQIADATNAQRIVAVNEVVVMHSQSPHFPQNGSNDLVFKIKDPASSALRETILQQVQPHQTEIRQIQQLFKCRFCSSSYSVESDLQRHLLLHIHPQYPSAECSGCGTYPCQCGSDEPLSLKVTSSSSTARSSFSSDASSSCSLQPADLSMGKQMISIDLRQQSQFQLQNKTDQLNNVYKPKFQAAYSLNENVMSSVADTFSPSKLNSDSVTNSTMSIISNKDFQSVTCRSSDNNLNNKCDNSTSKKSSLATACQVTSAPSFNIKRDASNFSKVLGTTVFLKDLKSPSPDLGERIDKIIVQNQEIMEADNPLLGRKFRRQSSLGALDGDSSVRNKRLGTSESKLKAGNQTLQKVIRNCPPEGSQSGSAVFFTDFQTNSMTFKRSQSVTPSHSVAISTSLPSVQNRTTVSARGVQLTQHEVSEGHKRSNITPGTLVGIQEHDVLRQHIIKLPDTETNKIILSKGQSLALQGTSIVPVTSMAAIILVCPNCPASFKSRETLDIHMENHCGRSSSSSRRSMSRSEDEISKQGRSREGSRSSMEQDLALDLQKKPKSRDSTPTAYFRAGSLGPDACRVQHEHVRLHKSLSPFTRQTSLEPSLPPNKKRRLSSDPPHSINSRLPQHLLLQNGIVIHKSRVSGTAKTLDECRKPTVHQLCGGEVKICDGTEYKTIKIDTSECNRNLALDMCIVNPIVDDSCKYVDQVPSSLVVTLSKSGLNCGGTVVESKIGSHASTSVVPSSASNQLLVNDSNAAVHFSGKYSSISKPDMGTTVPNISSLQQYAPQLQLPNLAIPGVPIPNFVGGFLSKSSRSPVISKPKVIISVTSSDTRPSGDNQNSRVLAIVKTNQAIKEQVTPSILSIGKEKVPYVPGMPGPYSQASTTTAQPDDPLPSKANQPRKMVTLDLSQNAPAKSISAIELKTPVRIPEIKIEIPSIQVKQADTNAMQQEQQKCQLKISSGSVVNRPLILTANASINSLPHDEMSQAEKVIKVSTTIAETVKETFPMPRKRPDTLALKPHQFVPKSTSLLIGTTIMSPDTPRPKKSCAQLFLDGSAYTYLGLKVSTKTTYCCIYRPQPMYVPQSPNSKLSMYSIWQIRKPAEDNLFNLNIYESMGLYASRSDINRAYTVAKPSVTEMLYTYSNDIMKGTVSGISKTDACDDRQSISPDIHDGNGRYQNSVEMKDITMSELEGTSITSSSSESSVVSGTEADELHGSSKRVKIFDGGFKSTEDYTYVRGRGRGRYVCETCGIRCKKPSMLKKHIRTHTDLRPYPCVPCISRFKTKGNLTKHLKSKAHYKRCMQLGVLPESIPGSGEFSASEPTDEDVDEEEDEDDEDGDDDFGDDEDDDEFEYGIRESSSRENSSTRTDPPPPPPESAMVLHQLCSSSSSSQLPLELTVKSLDVTMSTGNDDPPFEDTPMDLTVKKNAASPLVSPRVHLSASHGHPSSSRPNFLSLSTRMTSTTAGIGPLLSPQTPAGLLSPATPIREHPADILSPVTESSTLLKSIYSTTERAGRASCATSTSLPMEGIREKSGVMMKAYLTEKAIQETFIKRHQYQGSSSTSHTDLASSTVTAFHNTLTASDAASGKQSSCKSETEKVSLNNGSIKPKSYYFDKWYSSKPPLQHLKKDPVVSPLVSSAVATTTPHYVYLIDNKVDDIANKKHEPFNTNPTNNSVESKNFGKLTSQTNVFNVSIGNNPKLVLTPSNHNNKFSSMSTSKSKPSSEGSSSCHNSTYSTSTNGSNAQIVYIKRDVTSKLEERANVAVSRIESNMDQNLSSTEKMKITTVFTSTLGGTQTIKKPQPAKTSNAISTEVASTSPPVSLSSDRLLKETGTDKLVLSKQHATSSSSSMTPKQDAASPDSQLRESETQKSGLESQVDDLQVEDRKPVSTGVQPQRSVASSIQSTSLPEMPVVTVSNTITTVISSNKNTTVKAVVKSTPSVVGPSGVAVMPPSSCVNAGGRSAMNLTVLNNSGDDSGPSFLSPSGVVPTTSNSRPSSEDGRCRCSICNKEFQKFSQLTLHMNIHYFERPYKCGACSVSFRSNGHLQKHRRSATHFNKVNMNLTFGAASTDNPRPFKCHDCKVAFRIHGHLAKHLRSKMHILKLECLGKLPFGVYAEMERTGNTLSNIDTTDCENSLLSLQALAKKLFERDADKLVAWQNGSSESNRTRTVSNSSNNSEEYPLADDQEDPPLGDSGDENDCSSSSRNGECSATPTPPPQSSSPTYVIHSSSTPPCSSPQLTSSSSNKSKPPADLHSSSPAGLSGPASSVPSSTPRLLASTHHLTVTPVNVTSSPSS